MGQWIERLARFYPILQRIDPNEDAIGLQQLGAPLVGKLLVIDGRFGIDADRGEFLEDAMKAIVGRGGVAARLAVTTPDNRNFGNVMAVSPTPAKAGSSGCRNK